ncbi:MAG: prepilin peptidase [Candidatus Micrarchaeota archaeon]|mgnify:CR=1 FL=1
MEVLNFEMIRIIVALIGTGAAAYQDYKTSFIDEKIIYLMLAAGLFLNLLHFIITNDLLIVYALIVSIAILLFGYLFYRKGQLGMGDVLLFVAIQQILPLTPASLHFLNPINFQFPDLTGIPDVSPFLLHYMKVFENGIFFITIFLISSFIATLGSSFQYMLALFSSKKPLRPNMLYGATSLLLLIFGGFFLYSMFGLNVLSALFFLLFVASAFFLTFREQILDQVVIQRIPISRIEDEDILALERMPKDLVKKYKLEKVLTAVQVKILKEIQRKEGMKLFPVNKILPRFGPYIFIALLLALFFGNIMEIILFLTAR